MAHLGGACQRCHVRKRGRGIPFFLRGQIEWIERGSFSPTTRLLGAEGVKGLLSSYSVFSSGRIGGFLLPLLGLLELKEWEPPLIWTQIYRVEAVEGVLSSYSIQPSRRGGRQPPSYLVQLNRRNGGRPTLLLDLTELKEWEASPSYSIQPSRRIKGEGSRPATRSVQVKGEEVFPPPTWLSQVEGVRAFPPVFPGKPSRRSENLLLFYSVYGRVG